MNAESLWLVLALASGAALAWMLAHARSGPLRARAETAEQRAAGLAAELDALRKNQAELAADHARLDERLAAEQRLATEKLAWLERAKQQLGDSFKALSAEALRPAVNPSCALPRRTWASSRRVPRPSCTPASRRSTP